FVQEYRGAKLRMVGAGLVHGGLLFACGGDGSGERAMFAVKLGKEPGLAWRLDKGTPYVPCILARGQHLYTVNDEGAVVCRDAKTGDEAWRQRLPSSVSASPVLVEGRLFVFGEKGEATVIEAKPDKPRVLGKNSVGEAVFASPAVAGGRLYVRGSKHLFCIGTPKGKGDGR
ncbi:MAG: PQQ-like beta-propeller repeat protein, partial [Gemmataceae bacterium]|nr:PQQ-like beta-propeller repeat protein [Gemmataceae bacterium]